MQLKSYLNIKFPVKKSSKSSKYYNGLPFKGKGNFFPLEYISVSVLEKRKYCE